MTLLTRATAFIDWDTARRVAATNPRHGRIELTQRSFLALQESLADVLTESYPKSAFRVSLRVYHGWHRGKTKTQDRRDFERDVIAGCISRSINRISFPPEVTLGDTLLCGGPRCSLYDTLRRREDGTDEQKMVDTALVSDLLHFARNNRDTLALVVGDDDDLLPGVFTALQWGANVKVIRLRENNNPHLLTDNLIHRMHRHTA